MQQHRTHVFRKKESLLEKPAGATFDFGGFVGKRLTANRERWLLTAPKANPAMLQMFRDQERTPHRDLLPWSGEFVGKYLISAIQSWQLSRDERLRALIDEIVTELIDAQQPDGYLGPFPPGHRLTSDRWDVWGHYHWIQALLMYFADTGSVAALGACCRAGDLLHRTFVGTGERMKAPEQNLAILHGACLLYEATGEKRYLELAEWVIEELSKPGSCGYIEDAQAAREIQEFRARRWEGLHCIQGIYELGLLTGNHEYHEAFSTIWWAMLKGDRHNTGGFTSAEAFQGNPYDPRAIETCCTVAWIALTIDMLRLTADSRVADELELSLYNGVLGAQHPSGRWWTYNTPMDGYRKASAHEIVFQARPGSPELNCCSVNAPRGLGMLSEWAVMTSRDRVAINYYGPGTVSVPLPSGGSVTLRQETNYPLDGSVRIVILPEGAEEFRLSFRVPQWSTQTRIEVNGHALDPPSAGTYVDVRRAWDRNDSVSLHFDLTPHFWAGEQELQGKASVYRGPILLAYDRYFNDMDPDEIPTLDAWTLDGEVVSWKGWIEPMQLWRFPSKNGRDVLLCDFASAGATGTPYRSWLSVEGVSPVPFGRENPMRITRPH